MTSDEARATAYPFERTRGRKVVGTVGALYAAMEEGFVTQAVDALDLTFEGIPGDAHSGTTRRSGGREPWYPRGTEMRNERQLSILSMAELAATAQALSIPRIEPEWVGCNVILDGIEHLTWLPPRTLLFFEGGVTLKVDGDNGPCRLSGRSIAGHYEGRGDIETEFPKAAMHRRGLVAWVEKPGRVERGERCRAQIPPQWIYAP